jgi:hypothetical protein
MEKKIKPYGTVSSQGEKFLLLEPYSQRNVMSDGTFEFLVVPYDAMMLIIKYVPRFIRVTEFLLEYSDINEITIQVSKLEE